MTKEARLEEIKAGLVRLRMLDPAYKAVSNAPYHRYQLNPPLSETKVSEFEHKHEVTLPAEYRTFLLQVGDGGAGPDVGLYPLDRLLPSSRLGKIFPHTKVWSPYEKPTWPQVDIPDGRTFDFWDNFGRLWDGALTIGGAGCDFRNLLVITGAERGNIWLSEMDNEMGFLPYSGLEHEPKQNQMFPFYALGGSGRISFLDWYEHWLHMSLRNCGGHPTTD